MEQELKEIKESVKKVESSISNFLESGHISDNISCLRTNASILNILADKLLKIREDNPNLTLNGFKNK